MWVTKRGKEGITEKSAGQIREVEQKNEFDMVDKKRGETKEEMCAGL